MVTRALLLLAIVASCSTPYVFVPAPPPLRPREQPLPAPNAPDGRLPTSFVPTGYKAGLSLDPSDRAFRGAIEITGTLTAPSKVIWLHAEGLVIHAAEARPASSSAKPRRLVTQAPDHKLMALRALTTLAPGEWTLRIEYSGTWNNIEAFGGFVQIYRGAPYVFTQFEPDFARQVFPCVDEPDRKVPWQLTLTAPEHLVVASNTPVETRVVDKKGKMQVVSFARTPPLPSYLVAFAVGPFTELDGGRSKNGTPVRILSLYDQPATTEQAANVTASLDAIEDWVGIPFPYPKLDVVVVPRTTHWWYAMENAGLVTIHAASLRDPDTWDRVMAHEIAHHWFGNLVTLAWWDDLWLNEAFAEWVAVVATKGQLPDLQTLSVFPPIVSKVVDPRRENGSSARHRGPAVLSRFASFVGLTKMQSAITRYLEAHPHGTATTNDFLAALAITAGADSSRLLARYLESPSSEPRAELQCPKGAEPRVKVTDLRLAEEIVCVAFERDGKRIDDCRRTTADGFALDTKSCPRWFLGENIAATDITPLVDLAWPFLTVREQHRLFDRAIAAGPTTTWSILPRVIGTTDSATRDLVEQRLWHTRSRLDDKQLLARFDAWVLAELGPRMRASDMAGPFGLAAIGALVGDPTLLAHARSLVSTKSDGAMNARTVLAQLDPGVAESELEKVLTLQDRTDAARNAMKYSPFTFELIKKHASRVDKKNGAALSLLRGICNVPYKDVEDVIRSIDPATGDLAILAREHASCVSERSITATAVRTFLDARDKKTNAKKR